MNVAAACPPEDPASAFLHSQQDVVLTEFFSPFAPDKRERDLKMVDLADLIRKTTQSEKSKLPWLKLAKFGDLRTDKGSLRHDENLIAITGIEADYDGEVVSFDEAIAILGRAGIEGIVCTSPSHTDGKPRWRVLCPTSREYPPQDRGRFVARLNGVYGGVFAAESWTLSQCYYYGSVRSNPEHRVHVVSGTRIDLHDQLDANARGKPNTAAAAGGNDNRKGPLDEAALLQQIISGDSYHTAVVRLLGKWALVGVPLLDAKTRLVDAFEAVFPPDRDAKWQQRFGDLDRCLLDIYGKQAKQMDEAPALAEPPPDVADETIPTAEWWRDRKLGKPEPLLGEIITNTTRGLLAGPTGIGKTHLAMGMAAGLAAGRDFAHWHVSRPVCVLYVDGEMARDLLQDRIVDLRRRLGNPDLSNLVVLCREDFPGMQPMNTEAGHAFLLAKVKSWQIEVVIFDNRMSLLTGDMKEEQPWTDAMPLVLALTRARVAQIWIDHTGHDATKVYGSKTKEWQMDFVALLSKVERVEVDIAFKIEFTKARRRRPETRADFETVALTLHHDHWIVEGSAQTLAYAKVSRSAAAFHGALLDALAISSKGETTREAWFSECVRLGLVAKLETEDTHRERERKRAPFRKYLSELKTANLIGVDGETVRDLAGRRL